VNLASVTFIDSAGIGVLVGLWHRVGASHGNLAL
jgi:anti-anti-sigma factor